MILVTRKMFMYGVLLALPALSVPAHERAGAGPAASPRCCSTSCSWASIASAVCYITWMMAMKRVGVVRSGVYIYLIPVITMLGAAAILLRDPVHPLSDRRRGADDCGAVLSASFGGNG